MSDGVRCPKGQAVGSCCAIQPSGSVFLQELLNCRADVAKRISITKSAVHGAEEAPMSEPVNVAKTLFAMIKQKADNLRRERAGLTEPDSLIKAAEQDPRVYAAYVEALRCGPSPGDRWPTAPVAKAAPTAQEQVFARAIALAKAHVSKGTAKTEADALSDVWRDNPALYTVYRQSFGRGGSSQAASED